MSINIHENINILASSLSSALRPKHARNGLDHLNDLLTLKKDPLKRIKEAIKSAMDKSTCETFNRAYKTKDAVKAKVDKKIGQLLKVTSPEKQVAAAYEFGNELYNEFKRNPNNVMETESTKNTFSK